MQMEAPLMEEYSDDILLDPYTRTKQESIKLAEKYTNL